MEMPCSALFRIFWTFRRVAGVRCLLTKLCKVPFRSIPEQTNTEYPWCCMFSECGNQILWRFFGKYNTALQRRSPFAAGTWVSTHLQSISKHCRSVDKVSIQDRWNLADANWRKPCMCVCVSWSRLMARGVFPAFIYRYLTWSIFICLFCRDNHYNIKNIKTVGDR